MLPVHNPSLYKGMTLSEIILERKATLAQLMMFHKRRPTTTKAERIQEIKAEIEALEHLAKEKVK